MNIVRVALVAALLAIPATGRTASADEWKAALKANEERLRTGAFEAAEAEAVRVLQEVVRLVRSGPGEADFTGMPLGQLAMARAGAGDRRGAEWFWWSALQVQPNVERMDFPSFGDVGLAVRDLPRPPSALATALGSDEATVASWSKRWAGLTRGTLRVLRADAPAEATVVVGRPVLRPQAKDGDDDETVTVALTLDAQGRPTKPVVLPPLASPAHSAAALLSIEQWKLEPPPGREVAATAVVHFPAEAGFWAEVPSAPLGPKAADQREQAVLTALREGAHSKALNASEDLVAKLVDSGYGLKDHGERLARALTLRELAAERAGRPEIATSSRAAAEGLDPSAALQVRASMGMKPSPMSADSKAADGTIARKITRESAITPPVLMRKVEPAYPAMARKALARGEVILECVIDEKGGVQVHEVLKTAEPGITVAAIEAVRQWRYTPAMLEGKPIAVFLVVRLKFNLAGG